MKLKAKRKERASKNVQKSRKGFVRTLTELPSWVGLFMIFSVLIIVGLAIALPIALLNQKEIDNVLYAEKNFELEKIGDAYQITKYIGTEKTVFIPDTYKDLPITTIGDYAFQDTDISQVDLTGSKVTTLGEYCFKNSTLKSVIFTGVQTSLGEGAFYGCRNISNFVTDGVDTFARTQFTAINDRTFEGCGITMLKLPNTVSSFGAYSFKDSNIQNLIFSSGNINSVGQDALEGSTLFYANMYNKVCIFNDILWGVQDNFNQTTYQIETRIVANNAFEDVISLTDVSFLPAVKVIGDYAFADCVNVVNMSFVSPNTISSIGYGCFENIDTSLMSTTTEDNYVLAYGIMLVSYNGLLSTLDVPARVKYVFPDAFSSVKNTLHSISFARTTNLSNYGKFNNFSVLERVDLPNGAKKITDDCFENCTNLKTVSIVDNGMLKCVGENAFKNCLKLELTSLPESVIQIMDSAFYGSSLGTDFGLSFNIEFVGTNAFYATPFISNLLNNPPSDGVVFSGSVVFAYLGQESELDMTIYKQVKTIYQNSFRENSKLTKVILPSTIVTIGDYAFYSCPNLKNISLSENMLQNIGDSAFMESGIESIVIPHSVLRIGNNAFKNCPFVAFNMRSGFGDLFDDNSKQLFIRPYLGSTILSGCHNIRELSVIGEVALHDFFGTATSAYASISVERTGTLGAIYQLPANLTKVTIVDNSTYVKNSFSENCSMIQEINLPTSVTGIGNYAFMNNTALTTFSIPSDSQIEILGEQVFKNCDKLKIINLPNQVESIGDECFYGCEEMTTFNFPTALKVIPTKAFYNCKKMTMSGNTTLPSRLEIICKYAFWGCTSMEMVTIPEKVVKVEEGAFYGCSGIKSLSILCGYSHFGCIDEYQATYPVGVFENCTSLSSVTLNSQFNRIPSFMFKNCTSLESFTFPTYVWGIYEGAFNGSGLKNVIFSSNMNTLGGRTNTFLDSNLEVVGAFENCQSMVNADLSDSSLLNISKNSFKNCKNLIQLALPVSLEVIGEKAFMGCEQLYTIGYSMTGDLAMNISSSLHTIQESAFEGCSSLKYWNQTVKTYYGRITNHTTVLSAYEFILPYNLNIIETNAFKGCSSLLSVYLPNTMSYIDIGTFNGCNSMQTIRLPFVGTASTQYATQLSLFGNIFGTCTEGGIVQSLGGTSYRFAVPESLIAIHFKPSSVNSTYIANIDARVIITYNAQ